MKTLLALLTFVITLSSTSFALEDALRITITNLSNGYADQTAIRFLNGASQGFDGSYDAYKLFGPTTVNNPSIFTRSSEGYPLSINAYPALEEIESFDLFTWTPLADSFTLEFEEIGAFAPGTFILIEDQITGLFYPAREGEVLYFELPSNHGSATYRFRLHFAIPIELSANASCTGSNTGKIQITYPQLYAFEADVYDASGSLVYESVGITHTDSISQLAAGTYTVVPSWLNVATDTLETTVATQPDFHISASIEHCTNPWSKDGAIDVSLSMDSSGCTYAWNDGTTTKDRWQLSVGNYALTVSDSNGCTQSDSFKVHYEGGFTQVKLQDQFQDSLIEEESNETYSSRGVNDGEMLNVANSNGNGLTVDLYPNPTRGLLHVLVEGAYQSWSYTIYDQQGRIMMQTKEMNIPSSQIQTARLSPGYYILKVSNGGEMALKKFLVMR